MANKESEHQLFEAFSSLNDAAEAKSFLIDLCTPAEISAMADRLRVVGDIKNGKPYRAIYQETGVSSTTVGRVARCIALGTGGYDMIYERLENNKENEKNKTQNSRSKKRASK